METRIKYKDNIRRTLRELQEKAKDRMAWLELVTGLFPIGEYRTEKVA